MLGKNIATMNLSTLSDFLVIYRLNVSIHYLEVKYMWRAKEIHKKKNEEISESLFNWILKYTIKPHQS